MSAVLELPFAGTTPTLRTVHVVALGRTIVCAADGSAGPRELVLEDTRAYPPRVHPCPGCSFVERCRSATEERTEADGWPESKGCPTAEGWRAAERAYAAASADRGAA